MKDVLQYFCYIEMHYFRPVLISGGHAHVQKALASSSSVDKTSPLSSSSSSTEHLESITVCSERVLQVMKWGLIPSWHKGEPSSFPALLNNCRYEGMMEKPSFRNAISRRQRCVVLVDG